MASPQTPMLLRAGPLIETHVVRYGRLKPLVMAIYYVALLYLLVSAGHPMGRVVALTVVLALSIGSQLFALFCAHHRRIGPRGIAHANFWHLGVLLAAFGLTGGLHSPMIVSVLTPMVSAMVIFGRAMHTRTIAIAMAVGALVLALLPAAWLGPTIPEPFWTTIAALSIFTAVTILWTSMAALAEAFREKGMQLFRTREEVVAQAMARARGLEQVGSKVAHELKNPLAAIKGLVQLVGRGSTADERTRERLAVVEREVARMEVILSDYLSFSRPLEDLQTTDLPLTEVVDDVLAALEGRALAARVRLQREGTAAGFGDPRRIKEALLNLVANALDATPAGGAVTVSLEQSECGGARICVTDTGTGMSKEVLGRLGTPFFTTREGGTGLGVTLARAAFNQHGGDLRFESSPGAGTRATAFLPVRSAQQTRRAGPCGQNR